MTSMNICCCVLMTILSCTTIASATISFKVLPTITVSNPSFLSVWPRTENGTDTLFITQFTGNPFQSGSISFVDNITAALANGDQTYQVTQLCDNLKWPNEISQVPVNAISTLKQPAILIPDGFLVPGKDNGAVYLVTTDQAPATPIRLDTGRNSYFYHRAIWRDMNGDGLLDILTARATKPFFGSGSGELLWLEQPSSGDPLTQVPWNEHVITAGPDVFFVVTAENDTEFQIAAAQFFTSALVLYNIDSKTGQLLSQQTLDSSNGPFEGIQYLDLDGDGNKEILTNSHQGGNGGAILAYQSTEGVNTFDKMHTLATGFNVVVSGIGQAAPGIPYGFNPHSTSASNDTIPSILVAGDGAGAAYLLTPNGTPFGYDMTVIENNGHTVGSIGIAPSQEYIFVPNYEGGSINPYAVSN